MPVAFILSVINLKINFLKKQRIRRRLLRDYSDPTDIPDQCFIGLYRLNKRAFLMILEEICKHMYKSSIPEIIRLASVLRFLAVGSYQGVISNDLNIAMDRTTFCRVLWKVINVLEERLCGQWIRLEMTEQEIKESKIDFFNKFKIPGVVGCLDGTHVRLIKPTSNSEVYYCRKGYYSINVLIICDYQMKIRAVDASRPGSCHDSFVWSLSDAKTYFAEIYKNNNRSGWLLADSAYALEPYVIVPYRSPANGSIQHKFNLVHSSGRNIVERTIGNLKSRFRCLQVCLPYTPLKVVKIANVCCALHNICKQYNVPLEEEIFPESINDMEEDDEELENNSDGIQIRNNIANSLR